MQRMQNIKVSKQMLLKRFCSHFFWPRDLISQICPGEPTSEKRIQDSSTSKMEHEMLGLDINNWRTPYVVFGFILTMWLLYWVIMTFTIKNYNDDWIVRGLFGDMFGAINALFSGLAFAGLIITFLLQREELKAQRQRATEQYAGAQGSKDLDDTLAGSYEWEHCAEL